MDGNGSKIEIFNPFGEASELLHRCDSVRRHGYTFANSSDAWCFLAFVPAAVRS
jgi:hypothetical protein